MARIVADCVNMQSSHLPVKDKQSGFGYTSESQI